LSLQGEADFPALGVVGERGYGYDATNARLMTTTDRESWTTITEGQFVDIAWLPRGRIVSWSPCRPVCARLASLARAGPSERHHGWCGLTPTRMGYCITAEGDPYTAGEPDGKWRRAGRVPGTPAALEVGESAWYATDQGIFTSTDSGARWAVLADAPE
jgi:hypothetical protein